MPQVSRRKLGIVVSAPSRGREQGTTRPPPLHSSERHCAASQIRKVGDAQEQPSPRGPLHGPQGRPGHRHAGEPPQPKVWPSLSWGPSPPVPWSLSLVARPPGDGGNEHRDDIVPSRFADAAFTSGCEVGTGTRQQDRSTAPVASPQKPREHTMTRFIQENWTVIIFAAAMLAMHLGRRGGQHRGMSGCGGGHAGHQDTSSAGARRSHPAGRTDGDSTPQDSTPRDSTPQDSAQPRDPESALPSPVHHHRSPLLH